MKSFLAACVAIALLAYLAHYGFERAGFSSAQVQSDRQTVRLD